MILAPRTSEILHYHGFCGCGGFAKGMNRGRARVGHVEARFRCIGGFDVDAAAVRDFERLAGARGTVLDLFSREDYVAFHGHEPPASWREATVEDIRRSAGYEVPHILCLSPPCKGFSGLLPQARSNDEKYQALNRLALRGLTLMLEAWGDTPPEFVLLENVPRIATRGRRLLDAMQAILRSFRYVSVETTHDCGEIGNLGQTRKRFLMVARHAEKVPTLLYTPPRRPLRSVGDVIGPFPMPGDVAAAGPMHRVRELQAKTWIRLALVEAGSDWRSLQKLRVENGLLKDYGLAPDVEYHRGAYGVAPWDKHAGTVTAGGRPGQGVFSVGDPRPGYTGEYSQLGVLPWEEPTGAVSGQSAPGGGAYSVADPRLQPDAARHWNKFRVVDWARSAGTIVGNAHRPGGGEQSVADPRLGHGPAGPHFSNVYRVVRFDQPAPTATAGTSPSAGGIAVADPRPHADRRRGALGVLDWNKAAGTVIGESWPTNGAFAVGDPRPGLNADGHYKTAGHYGVVPWDRASGAVVGSAGHDNGPFSVADPRALPAPDERLVMVIRALDNSWHRPFTTLELAALQNLVEAGEKLELDGLSDSAWRERIGNCVPPAAGEAIASQMGKTLLLAWSGETFALGATPIWVRDVAIAIALHQPEVIH